ncbi:hypothetical protein DLAC_08889 [Tieghemostelium lacteum]|uniref:Uncharacterized protein n=1 Tax=Tieghemostelium lacteum TaxID=361077 RepID=A0A151Z8J4_TIELA|nr:hypothetical protein DLAC_08889 [Tieghemostelium lacteum]|eukprot:KYQ90286.1 hypothetical protein DLAC_08889 [Tieghemostelium lacteum]
MSLSLPKFIIKNIFKECLDSFKQPKNDYYVPIFLYFYNNYGLINKDCRDIVLKVPYDKELLVETEQELKRIVSLLNQGVLIVTDVTLLFTCKDENLYHRLVYHQNINNCISGGNGSELEETLKKNYQLTIDSSVTAKLNLDVNIFEIKSVQDRIKEVVKIRGSADSAKNLSIYLIDHYASSMLDHDQYSNMNRDVLELMDEYKTKYYNFKAHVLLELYQPTIYPKYLKNLTFDGSFTITLSNYLDIVNNNQQLKELKITIKIIGRESSLLKPIQTHQSLENVNLQCNSNRENIVTTSDLCTMLNQNKLVTILCINMHDPVSSYNRSTWQIHNNTLKRLSISSYEISYPMALWKSPSALEAQLQSGLSSIISLKFHPNLTTLVVPTSSSINLDHFLKLPLKHLKIYSSHSPNPPTEESLKQFDKLSQHPTVKIVDLSAPSELIPRFLKNASQSIHTLTITVSGDFGDDLVQCLSNTTIETIYINNFASKPTIKIYDILNKNTTLKSLEYHVEYSSTYDNEMIEKLKEYYQSTIHPILPDRLFFNFINVWDIYFLILKNKQ